MFVFFSKFLPLLVYPMGLACILLALALASRKEGRQRLAIFLALAVLFLSGNRWISMSAVRSLEWQYLPPENSASADAIVILGGGTDAPDFPRPMVDLTSAGDRVLYGGLLYKEGKAPLILLSGGNIAWLGAKGNTPAEQMAEILDLLEIPHDHVLLQTRSQNTYEDALYSGEMLKEKGITRIFLVTSALHMPRSVRLFTKQGLEVIPAPTDYRVTQAVWEDLKNPSLEFLIINSLPNISNAGALTSALKEYLGMIIYHWRGWI
ncbi:MAG: YdcF family protein [Anaerolineaceae bacterium]|nr:YdcF family protein [Anaerolineaceae bacterium]